MIGVATQAQAEPQSQDDFSSAGPYVGTGFALGFDNFDPGSSDVDIPVGFDFWAGYRFIPNLAVEVELAYLNGFDASSPPPNDYRDVLALTGNLKAYVLTGRFQPFAVAGIGMTHWRMGTGASDEDFAARFGGGIDIYLTESFALEVKTSYVLTTGDLDGSDYVDLTFGGQFRF
jgi:opacity protein-like surface antigen